MIHYAQKAAQSAQPLVGKAVDRALRATLTYAAEIRRMMATDMRETEVHRGAVTREDLTGLGWTNKQIDDHHEAAADQARARPDRRIKQPRRAAA